MARRAEGSRCMHDAVRAYEEAKDTLEGGPDNDILHSSHDGKSRNTVRGGGGFDICYVDKSDRVKGCERNY